MYTRLLYLFDLISWAIFHQNNLGSLIVCTSLRHHYHSKISLALP